MKSDSLTVKNQSAIWGWLITACTCINLVGKVVGYIIRLCSSGTVLCLKTFGISSNSSLSATVDGGVTMSQTELQEATDNVNCSLSSNTHSRKNSLLRAHLIWHICNALEPYSNNLWSLDQFASCMQENCVGSLVIKYWKMGQTHSLQPRILHDCKCTVLL